MTRENLNELIELLKKMPELKTQTEVEWKEIGAGEKLRALSMLLKGNVIPTKSLQFWCIKKRKMKKKKTAVIFEPTKLNNMNRE